MLARILKPKVKQLKTWVVVPPNSMLTTSALADKFIIKLTPTMNFTWEMHEFEFELTLIFPKLGGCCSPKP